MKLTMYPNVDVNKIKYKALPRSTTVTRLQ